MASTREEAAMRRALRLAASPDVPLGPNPRVGAVLLDRDGSVVGEGYHRGAGNAHAEVEALRDAGPLAHGATAVVTLEPCNHTGRTGPCSTALLEAGVGRVVFAQRDRTELATGGAGVLRSAGVDVEGGVLAAEAAELNPALTFAMAHGRPFVTYKFAASLDGRVAAADGTSQWITGDAARADAHRLRSEVDAVVVGTGTALADDPRLTVRGLADSAARPLRVVVGERKLPASLRLFDDAAPSMHVETRDPGELLRVLAARNVRHVLLEGGPTLAAAFLKAGLVERVVAYVAPMLLGAGTSAMVDFGAGSIDEALRLRLDDVTSIDGDVRITCTVVEKPQTPQSPSHA
jgi:diaminohydroxyphosphoribosylaminopyrimidine deaminase/5-amino-6-(5-phosphoribosylamino)uracil reductase